MLPTYNVFRKSTEKRDEIKAKPKRTDKTLNPGAPGLKHADVMGAPGGMSSLSSFTGHMASLCDHGYIGLRVSGWLCMVK